ncbi:hypothetical protein QK290_18170 [Pseudarthrobacter sp. AL07]|nr:MULTISPECIES: hypothetical protein [unclassified Pseudarthrobacter]MDI3196322.1 hypothetical protein [Pseudarthrobacter sp. AL20]MDI3210382.1 hypothetical protein [Pseudarthrobacter sp. AL07]
MTEITVNEAEQRRSTDRILDVREDFEVADGMIAWTRAGLPTT